MYRRPQTGRARARTRARTFIAKACTRTRAIEIKPRYYVPEENEPVAPSKPEVCTRSIKCIKQFVTKLHRAAAATVVSYALVIQHSRRSEVTGERRRRNPPPRYARHEDMDGVARANFSAAGALYRLENYYELAL